MFVTAIYANLTAFAYFPVNFANRPIFYRERDSGMYRCSAWTLAQVCEISSKFRRIFDENVQASADFPVIAFGTILFAAPLYWVSGLQADAGK